MFGKSSSSREQRQGAERKGQPTEQMFCGAIIQEQENKCSIFNR